MSAEAAHGKFGCPACGRQFAWRPQLAGKNAKCKCGAAVQVPAEDPAAPSPAPAAEPDGDPFAALSAAAAAESDAYDVTDDAGPRCPGCQRPLAAGAVLCVHCGFNTKTGKRMSTVIGGDDEPAGGAAKKPGKAAPAPGAGGAGGGAAGFPGSRRKPDTDDDAAGGASKLKPVLIVVALLLVVGGAVFGFRQLSGGGSGGGTSTHEVDKEVEGLLDNHGRSELKAWLADNARQQRMVMGMNERQAEAYADRLYKMGAKQVLAFGAMMTTVLAVELPADPAQRTELFKYQKEWHESMFETVQTDEGQKYILLKMKLVR